MKKIIVTLILALFAFDSFSQVIERSYVTINREKKTTMSYEWKGGDAISFTFLVDGTEGECQFILSKDNGEMALMNKYLKAVREKYIEWTEIAINNQVKDFSMEMPINYPGNLNIFWNGVRYFDQTNFRFSFNVDKEGNTFLYAGGALQYTLNEHITNVWFLSINSLFELDTLIDSLNEDNYREECERKRGYVELFK